MREKLVVLEGGENRCEGVGDIVCFRVGRIGVWLGKNSGRVEEILGTEGVEVTGEGRISTA